MRTATANFQTELDKKTGAQPRRVMELVTPSGTFYYSDTTVTIDAQVYSPEVISFGNINSQFIPGEDTVRTESITVTLNNVSAKSAFILPGVTVTVYDWFLGLVTADKQAVFVGIIDGSPFWNDREITFSAKSIFQKFNKEIGKTLDANDWPLADPDYYSKVVPLVIGSYENLVVLPVVSPATSTLRADFEPLDTIIQLTSTTSPIGFPGSGTVIIDDVEYSYAAVSSNDLTGTTSPSVTHTKGAEVLHKSNIKFVVAKSFIDTPIKEITNLRVMPNDSTRIAEAVAIDPADYSINYTELVNSIYYATITLTETVSGVFIVDVDGYEDDNAGFYTGTPYALIEKPPDAIHFLWDNFSNGATSGDLDLAVSFLDARNNLPASYKYGFALTWSVNLDVLTAQLAQQGHCIFFISAGIGKLVRIKNTGTPDKIIDTDDYSPLTDGTEKKLQIQRVGMAREEIVNALELKYQYNMLLGVRLSGNAYAAISTISTPETLFSVSQYGENRQIWLLWAVRDSDMADDLRDKLLDRMAQPRTKTIFLSWSSLSLLEPGDILDFTSSQLGQTDQLVEVLSITNVPQNAKEKRPIELRIVVRELDLLIHGLETSQEGFLTIEDTQTYSTPWAGRGDDKLYLQSGQFSSTVKTSLSVGAVETGPNGITWDGTNTPWCGNEDEKLYLTSGQFTATIKTSEYVGGTDIPEDISWDGTNTPWCGLTDDKLYLTSGQFTATIKTSEDVTVFAAFSLGISYSGQDTPWCGKSDLYLQSGQFSGTVRTSQYVGAVDSSVEGISWDGGNTPWTGRGDMKLYLQSGQFSGTLKTSEYIGGVDTHPGGICTNNIDGRFIQLMQGNIETTATITVDDSKHFPTPVMGSFDDKLFLVSGQFTTTIKTSEDISAKSENPTGISFDGTNTPWSKWGTSGQLYLTSGQFSSTIKDSRDVSAFETTPQDISWDGTNTPWVGSQWAQLYLQSGQFTATLKTSEIVSSLDSFPRGISFDGRNTPWIGDEAILFLTSGQFSATIKTSEDISGTNNFPEGVSWDGTNTPWCGAGHKLYLTSGQFGSTVKTSEDMTGVVISPSGICTNNIDGRFSFVDRLFVSGETSLTISDLIETPTPWCGTEADKLYLQSGQFTSTVKTSEDVSPIDTGVRDIAWDGQNTPWCGQQATQLYLNSGQFTSTILTSYGVSGIDSTPSGLSFDGTNTPWVGDDANKLYLQSGQFTSTLITSYGVGGIDSNPSGISWDSENTPWCGYFDAKLYLTSGQFSATIKTSEIIGGVDNLPAGISWDGTNTLWSGSQADKLYLTSGQFTTTIKTSEDVTSVDNAVRGIDTNNVFSRLEVGNTNFHTPWIGNEADKLYLTSGQFSGTLKTSEDIGGVDTATRGMCWDGQDTPWIGDDERKLYLTSSQFSSTIKTSEYVGAVDDWPWGIGYDGTNTPWCGYAGDKLYLTSSQFSSTIKTSEAVGAVDTSPYGIDFDGTNTPWTGDQARQFYLTSGQFSSTLKDSISIGGTDLFPRGTSYNGIDLLWCGVSHDKLYLQSGGFSVTVKTSLDVGAIDNDVTGVGNNRYWGILTNEIVATIEAAATITVIDTISPNTYWSGNQADKLYYVSGQFSSSLKDSLSVGSVDTTLTGISWDGTNTPWSGAEADKLYLQSGGFDSTLKTSEYVGAGLPTDISWDGTNTPWSDSSQNKLFLTSGQFTATIKTSEDISTIDTSIQGISFDGTNTPWVGGQADKLYLTSSQFSSTIKTSEAVGTVDATPTGISWNGLNSLWCGIEAAKLYLTSGQFSATIKTSEDISSIDTDPTGICTDDVDARLGI